MCLCIFRVLLCIVCFCTDHFVMVPINLTCHYCLQHFVFEHLFHLYIHYCLTLFTWNTIVSSPPFRDTALLVCNRFPDFEINLGVSFIDSLYWWHSDSWVGCVLCTSDIRVNVDIKLCTKAVILLMLLLQNITYLQSFDLRYNGINKNDNLFQVTKIWL